MGTVTLRLAALPAHVRTARLVAAAVGRRAGLDAEQVDEVKLGVGEACARAVRLHQVAAPQEPVTVVMDDGERFLVTVTDVGPAGAEIAGDDDGGLLGLDELVDVDMLTAPAEDPRGGAGRVLPAGFGLAVIAGLVPDVVVGAAAGVGAPTGGGSGTSVCMSWPVPGAAGGQR